MALEIERKFIVINNDYRRMASSGQRISQGYLTRRVEGTVRIRTCGGKGWITVKGKNSGNVREEFEYEIPVQDAVELLKLCEGHILEKTRYIVNYLGYRWEIDKFHGDLAGLVIAEVELKDSAEEPPLPSFVGEEVTGNPMYYNSSL
ncbi:MAG: CYTH domain-containing protein [Prevotella sp.]|nr:CYTH domain-containing protein [Prevotella sp.]MCM1075104.1 CYTH domain-containing protein [Ruminococcus sp.]